MAVQLDERHGIALAPGEGEPLSATEDNVLKAAHAELSVGESTSAAGPGPGPHVHREHTDAFYVLEGEVEFELAGSRVRVGPGAFVAATPNVVHAFDILGPQTRLLNLHAPDGGYAESRRGRRDGRESRQPYDASAPPDDGGAPASNAIVRLAGEGEQLRSGNRLAVVKADLPELSVFEFEIDGEFEGPPVHTHDDQTDSFYVLEGELEFTVEGRTFTGGPGTFVSAPRNVEHTFAKPGDGRVRFLNIHAPNAGFTDFLRRTSS